MKSQMAMSSIATIGKDATMVTLRTDIDKSSEGEMGAVIHSRTGRQSDRDGVMNVVEDSGGVSSAGSEIDGPRPSPPPSPSATSSSPALPFCGNGCFCCSRTASSFSWASSQGSYTGDAAAWSLPLSAPPPAVVVVPLCSR